MERIYFSSTEANSKIGRKVWVKVNSLHDLKKGLPGTVMKSVCLDRSANGFGVKVDWQASPSGAIMTVFTKSEYDSYLNEEPESIAKITYD